MPNYVNPIKILKEKIKLQEINKKVGFEWIKNLNYFIRDIPYSKEDFLQFGDKVRTSIWKSLQF